MSELRETTRRGSTDKNGVTRRAAVTHYHPAEPKVDLSSVASRTSRVREEGWTGLPEPVITAPRTAKPKKPQRVDVRYSDGAVIAQSRPRTRAERRARNRRIEANSRVFADLELDRLAERAREKGIEDRRQFIEQHDLSRFLRSWLQSTRLATLLFEQHGLGHVRLDARMVKLATWLRHGRDAIDISLAQSESVENQKLAFPDATGEEREQLMAEARAITLPDDPEVEFEEIVVRKERRRVLNKETGKYAWRNVEFRDVVTRREKVVRLHRDEDEAEVDAMLDEMTSRADLMDWGMSDEAALRTAERLGYYRDAASVYDAAQRAIDEQRAEAARQWLETNR